MTAQQPGFHIKSKSGTAPSVFRRRRLLVGVAAVLAVTGAGSVLFAVTHQDHAPHPSRQAQTAPLPSTTKPASAARASSKRVPTTTPSVTKVARPSLPPLQSGQSLATSSPVQLTIPAIGVDTSVMDLGLNPDGTVQTPPLSRNSVAGWYELSPTPGTRGASVMLGHVDSAAYGAGVFYRLGALNPGDQINVRRSDGTVAVFRVDRVAEYPKTQFPTSLVYGQTSYAALRLVTCGGSFDSSTGNYRDNIIAFASLVSSHSA